MNETAVESEAAAESRADVTARINAARQWVVGAEVKQVQPDLWRAHACPDTYDASLLVMGETREAARVLAHELVAKLNGPDS